MMMNKDTEVEVKSEEEGFKGAWFKAILEENLTKSGRKKICVRYLTLLDDTGLSPLKETVEQGFIRPVPPLEKYKDVVFEEGVMVDADHKDGWWTGVVIKEMKQDKYLVYFDSPPDVIQFDKKMLRAHVEWTGWIWNRPEIQKLDKSMFSPGTILEVSSVIDKVETAWFPAMIIKEIEEDGERMFIVKECNKYLNSNGDEARQTKNVDPRRVRPSPPAASVEEYQLLESVEAFRGSSWRQGLVRGILSNKRYMVSVGSTKEESVFKHSELRPLMEWEDGVWREGSIEQQPIQETPSKSVRKKSLRSCSSGAKPTTPTSTTKRTKRSMNFNDNDKKLASVVTVAALGKKVAGSVTSDDTTPSVIILQAKPTAKECDSSEASSLILTATPLKQSVAETGGNTSPEKTVEQVSNQNGLETDSTPQKMSEEENSEDKSRKRKREQEQHSDNETNGTCNGSKAAVNNASENICIDGVVDGQLLSSWIGSLPTEQSPYHTPNTVKNAAAVTHVGEDTVMTFPFAKKSPYWDKCESMEGFKSSPQRPHFSPLCELAKEDYREWLAIGMMVTFYGLLDEVKDLKLDDSPSKLNAISVSLAELEKHGFDVEATQSRISKILSLQDSLAKNTEEKKCFEKKIEEEENETREFEEEMAEVKQKILELQRQEAAAKANKEASEKKTVELKSSVEMIEQKLEEVVIEFEKTVSAPW
ncbi:hypothetical protein AALP_AA4G264100 [Arabis alpina]|uniref:Agenet domain-containing protein n=1 Tax=Arabis alpina TaxID=50452 RepID=A0A087H5T8_ARAAL|nr:hypothetical protein AALP_AA4G264100 [Arabis alpina]